MPAAPELVAITLIPIALRAAAGGCLLRRRGFDPRGGNQLLAFPLALLQIKLPELRDVLRADVQTPAAVIDALKIRVPRRIRNAERIEQTRLQEFEDRLARHLLHD